MGTWDPWQHVEEVADLIWRHLPEETGGAAIVFTPGRPVVLIDPRLPAHERTAALAHELIHAERGPLPRTAGAPAGLQMLAAREERRVDLEAARRLLPVAELLEVAEMVDDLGGHVTAAELAAEYELPVEVAELAIRQLHADGLVQLTG